MSTNRGRLTAHGTDGRVYGGDPDLIHVPDGTRGDVGRRVADFAEAEMRRGAENRSKKQKAAQALCPGCYMVVGFNTLVELAKRNGQSLRELGLSMAEAFLELAETEPTAASIESIKVRLDAQEAAYV